MRREFINMAKRGGCPRMVPMKGEIEGERVGGIASKHIPDESHLWLNSLPDKSHLRSPGGCLLSL
jgi:hypothetical protein